MREKPASKPSTSERNPPHRQWVVPGSPGTRGSYLCQSQRSAGTSVTLSRPVTRLSQNVSRSSAPGSRPAMPTTAIGAIALGLEPGASAAAGHRSSDVAAGGRTLPVAGSGTTELKFGVSDTAVSDTAVSDTADSGAVTAGAPRSSSTPDNALETAD